VFQVTFIVADARGTYTLIDTDYVDCFFRSEDALRGNGYEISMVANPTRARKGPAEFLQPFSGYLQSDGYSVYDAFDRRDVFTLLGCMAHARRKFEKAKTNDRQRSDFAMNLFRRLDAMEAESRNNNLDAAARKICVRNPAQKASWKN